MRARLLLMAAATTSLVLVAFLVPLAVLVRNAAADRAMSSAIVVAQSLSPAVATSNDATLKLAIAQANATGSNPITVFLPDGRVLGASAERSPLVAQAEAGQSANAEVDGGREVVVAVQGLPNNGTAVIRTFVPDSELQAGVVRSWAVLGGLGLGLLLVSLAVANQLARALTKPLTAVADVSYRLAHGSLGARAGNDGPPEVQQVSAGLNLLADRITELLAQERANVADLSHRLRTPLTALRIDVETLSDQVDRQRLADDLDAVERTVDAVIREADRPVREGVAAVCDAAACVRERVRFWAILAEEQRRRFDVAIDAGSIEVQLDANDLSACMDVLIGNVFAHTPDGTAFRVLLRATGTGAQLVVSDDGPGLPNAPVMARGVSGAGSTGLGLDIVHRAARRSGGGVTLGRSASGGAMITVELGPPAAAVVRRHRMPKQ